MPPKNDIFETLTLRRGSRKPYDNILAKVDYIKQTIEKEKKMNMGNYIKDIEKIVITKDGDDAVLCRGYCKNNLVVKSRSYCSPDDTFDFNIGAKLAIDRMYEGYDMTPKPKRKKYTGFIYGVFNITSIASVPNKTGSCVYKVKNGRIVDTVLLPCHNEDDFLIYDNMTEKALCETLNELYFCCNHIVNAGYLNIHD